MPEIYEEWQVAGHIRGEPYEFTWSRRRNPLLGDPAIAARHFLERFNREEATLAIYRRTVVIGDWQSQPVPEISNELRGAVRYVVADAINTHTRDHPDWSPHDLNDEKELSSFVRDKLLEKFVIQTR